VTPSFPFCPPLLSVLCIKLGMEHQQDDPMQDVAMAFRPPGLVTFLDPIPVDGFGGKCRTSQLA
jgi:hypothetical protein